MLMAPKYSPLHVFHWFCAIDLPCLWLLNFCAYMYSIDSNCAYCFIGPHRYMLIALDLHEVCPLICFHILFPVPICYWYGSIYGSYSLICFHASCPLMLLIWIHIWFFCLYSHWYGSIYGFLALCATIMAFHLVFGSSFSYLLYIYCPVHIHIIIILMLISVYLG